MPDFLSTLVSHTLGGTIAVVVLAVISRAKRVRLSAKWRRVAWILLCLRLAVPLSFGFPTLFELPVPSGDTAAETTPPDSSADDKETVGHPVGGGTPSIVNPPVSDSHFPENIQDTTSIREPGSAGTTVASIDYTQIIFAVWVIGASCMALWLLVTHIRFLLYVHRWGKSVDDRKELWRFNTLGKALRLRRLPQLIRCPGLRTPHARRSVQNRSAASGKLYRHSGTALLAVARARTLQTV